MQGRRMKGVKLNVAVATSTGRSCKAVIDTGCLLLILGPSLPYRTVHTVHFGSTPSSGPSAKLTRIEYMTEGFSTDLTDIE